MVRTVKKGSEEDAHRGMPTNHSRRLLDAETKRIDSSDGHLALPSDGYLKQNRAFPLAGCNRISPARNSSDGCYTDGDYSGEDECIGKYGTRGATRTNHHHHSHNDKHKSNSKNQHRRSLDVAWGSTPRSSSLPISKKSRVEKMTTAVNDGGKNNITRPLGSLGMRQNILVMGNRLGGTTGNTTAQETFSKSEASYHAAPLPNRQHTGTPSAMTLRGDHSSAPTFGSQSKDCSPLKFARTAMKLPHLPAQRRAFREPIASGSSPIKTGGHISLESRTENDDHGLMRRQRHADAGDGEKKNQSHALHAGAHANESLMPCHVQSSIVTSPKKTTTEAAVAASLYPSPTPPLSPPLTSPPLRAAVSLHSATYRHYSVTSESPRSASLTPPSCMDGGLYVATKNWPSPPRPGLQSPTSCSSLLLPPPVETNKDSIRFSDAKTSLSHYYLNNRLTLRSLKSPAYSMLEFSGFLNHGNDCYACSVLTFLLRSPLFSRTLIAAPMIGSECARGDDNVAKSMVSTRRRRKGLFSSAHHVLAHFVHLLQDSKAIEYGIDMSPLKEFLPKNFFSGRQEDAHEFFMAVVEKIEEESIGALKTLKKVRDDRTTPALMLESGKGELLGNGGPVEEEKVPSNGNMDSACVWINKLIQGRLLNIIRCQNEGCGHEIATEDPYVNLSLNLLKTDATDVASPAPVPPFFPDGNDVSLGGSMGNVPQNSPPNTKDHRSSLPFNLEGCYDVQKLLGHSLRFAPLDTYICDACGSSNHQQQGGCLLGTAPPVLLVQLKRFATTYSSLTGVNVSKDRTPVCVNEELTLYALCEEGQYNREKKQLSSPVRRGECAAKRWKERWKKREQEQQENEKGWQDEEKEKDDEATFYVRAIRYVYHLQGLVLHIGASPYAGHYVAEFAAELQPSCPDSGGDKKVVVDCNSKPRKVWCIADDDRVDVLSEDDVRMRRSHSTNCYLLLYERVKEEEVTCPLWYVLPCDA